LESRQIGRAVTLATSAVKQGINPSLVRRLSQCVPRAGGVQQSSDDDRPEDALQRIVVHPVRARARCYAAG